jgi:neutral ceramidase
MTCTTRRNADLAVLVLSLFSFFVLGAAPGDAVESAEVEWQVGLAQATITPVEPVRLSGYASRKTPSEGVASELFAKAMAIKDANGNRAVIVSTDLIGFPKSLADTLCQRITDKTGLSRSQILINSSHIHTGPSLSLDASELDFPAEHAAATERYTNWMLNQIVDMVVTSMGRFEPVRLSQGVGVAEFVMNRREFTDRGVILGFNPRGHVDRSVPVLRIDSPDGTLRAVVFGTACHNTTLGSRDIQVSGDFAGYAQAEVQRQHPGVQAMFMQGCAGDANPHPRGSEAIARLHGKTLGEEVLRVLDSELDPVGGPLTIAHKDVDLPLQWQLSRPEIEALREGGGGWRSFVVDQMIEAFDRAGHLPKHYSTPIAVWQFGSDLTLVALSGEVVVDYVPLLEDALGPRQLWIAAYCNDVYGYLPSARVLDQGGYETRGLYYGGAGIFSADAQSVLVEHVKRLAKQVR